MKPLTVGERRIWAAVFAAKLEGFDTKPVVVARAAVKATDVIVALRQVRPHDMPTPDDWMALVYASGGE